jgi:hypothetical protein
MTELELELVRYQDSARQKNQDMGHKTFEDKEIEDLRKNLKKQIAKEGELENQLKQKKEANEELEKR